MINLLLSMRHEYTVVIGLCGGGFEAAAPAELFHTFLSTKSLKRKIKNKKDFNSTYFLVDVTLFFNCP